MSPTGSQSQYQQADQQAHTLKGGEVGRLRQHWQEAGRSDGSAHFQTRIPYDIQHLRWTATGI